MLIAAGLGGLIVLALAFAGLAWWIFRSPLSELGTYDRDPVNATRMSRLALAGIGVYGVLCAGGIWDASWHMRYGIAGTISDFWSPPHITMYLSFATLASGALFALTRLIGTAGALRASFRAEPLLAAFFLVSLFQFSFGPVDEVWHKLFGVDLTAWALPHIVLGGLAVVALALLVPLQGRPFARGTWRWDAPAIFAFAVILWTPTAIAVGDWEFTLRSGAVPAGNPLFERPPWSYVVAGALPGAFVLGAAATVIERRWASALVALAMILFSGAVFALFAALGSSMPLWTTAVAYLVAGTVVDAVRRGSRGRALARGILFSACYAATSIALTVWSTRIVDLGLGDALGATILSLALGTSTYVAGARAGDLLIALPERADRSLDRRVAPSLAAPASRS
jgi:hypothetical protein